MWASKDTTRKCLRVAGAGEVSWGVGTRGLCLCAVACVASVGTGARPVHHVSRSGHPASLLGPGHPASGAPVDLSSCAPRDRTRRPGRVTSSAPPRTGPRARARPRAGPRLDRPRERAVIAIHRGSQTIELRGFNNTPQRDRVKSARALNANDRASRASLRQSFTFGIPVPLNVKTTAICALFLDSVTTQV